MGLFIDNLRWQAQQTNPNAYYKLCQKDMSGTRFAQELQKIIDGGIKDETGTEKDS